MRRAACVAWAMLLLAPADAQELHDYAWAFPLALPSADADSAWRVELIAAVYAQVHDAALRDIAVFNADGQPVPMARVAGPGAKPAATRRTPAPLLALPAGDSQAPAADLQRVLERDAAGRLRRIDARDAGAADATDATPTREWIVDASAIDGAIERIVFAWDAPDDGVVARFELAAGDDLEAWRPIGGGSVFALHHGASRLDRRDLATGGVRAKYLRVRRSDRGAPLAGLRVELRHAAPSAEAPALAWVDATAAPAASAGAAGTQVDYVLPAALPIERVQVEITTDNAVADIVVHGLAAGRPEPLARATVFRLRDRGDSLRNSDIEVAPRTRVGALRIEARTPIAAPPRVRVAFRPDRFVFLAEGRPPYTLAAGSARALRPDYPVEAALASLRSRLGADWQPHPARIGEGHPSGGAAALQPAPAPFAWRRWVLWGVLVAGAALVVVFALNLLRDTRRD